jgi:tetratricopeptide (TPR) repeat protein
MRMWLAAMVMALFGGGQDGKPVDTGTTPVLPAHKICSGDDAKTARPELLDGYGTGGFAITTKMPAAQVYFDNGMQLGAAFAHRASIAAFQEASRLDPGCAMCAWGEAWASGPTINYPVSAEESARLALLTARAEGIAKTGTELERALIAALKLRYVSGGRKGAANLAFAKAMDALAKAHPQDNAIATLAADAWLVAAGDAKDWHDGVHRSVALLQDALVRDPDYSPAIHFYIHASEMAGVPERATPFADRLTGLAPKASHLVHMPSHTYYWIGRYQDAADANVRAVALGIDNARRLGMPLPDGVWNLPYHAHNVHFGVGGALMSGDAKSALALSDPLVRVAALRDKGSVFSQAVAGMAYFAEGRFAEPSTVLAFPEPKLPYLKAYWRYARGEAQARLGNSAAVRSEANHIPWTIGSSDEDAAIGTRLARIAQLVLLGRAEMLDNRPAAALAIFRKAAALQEDRILKGFSDPPLWWYPVRRSVAEALLATGDAKAALAEADATLKMRPLDPMTLDVRARALARQGNAAAARSDARSARRLWRGAPGAFRPALT